MRRGGDVHLEPEGAGFVVLLPGEMDTVGVQAYEVCAADGDGTTGRALAAGVDVSGSGGVCRGEGVMDFEFYETPHAFSHWLFEEVPMAGRLFEPCAGSGAIVEA